MNAIEKGLETQLKNIQTKTGKSLEELSSLVQQSGLSKHGEIREMLKQKLGLGHGDANTLTHFALKSDGASAAQASNATIDDVVAAIYVGAKEHLRPIHDAVMTAIHPMGEFEIAPKKGYVSLRRKKQFAMITPATNTRVEVGLNMKGVEGTERLLAQPPGGMCNYKVKLTSAAEVDAELIGWIAQAFQNAG
ncbi:MAG: DUF4287 domain-containing protein [Blastocatellia bacterium]|nr:DUF4287 domain-containing protein [Blastocatellia bacterium]